MQTPNPATTSPASACVDAMLADLRRAGLKMTPQRIAIVRLFAVDRSHPTAQGLYDRLRPAFPSMSFATVYNTLDALGRSGLSSTIRVGHAARFDPNPRPHHHAVCDVCGEVEDVPADDATTQADQRLPPSLAAAGENGASSGRFIARSIERIYRGTCAACAAGAFDADVSHDSSTSRDPAAPRTEPLRAAQQ